MEPDLSGINLVKEYKTQEIQTESKKKERRTLQGYNLQWT